MDNKISRPDHDRREDDASAGGISSTTGNIIMGSSSQGQDESSSHTGKMSNDGKDNQGGYENALGVQVPVATPTPTTNANTRTDIRSQMKALIPPLPIMATPPQTPLTDAMTDIGSWKVSTPPSIDALRAMYQSSRRPGPHSSTPMTGVTPMYRPDTSFPSLTSLFPQMHQSGASRRTDHHPIASVGPGSMMAADNSALLEEDWATLFRNISTSDVATQGNIEQAYAALSRTTTTNPAVEAFWKFQQINLQSAIEEKESKSLTDDILRHNEDDAIMEPPAKKSKKLVATSGSESEKVVLRSPISSNDDKCTMFITDDKTEQESEGIGAMHDVENDVRDSSQDYEQQHAIQQSTQTLARTEREKHIISRKIQRLLLIRHCSTCTVPVSPPPLLPLAIPCPPLSFPTDFCGPCTDSDMTDVSPPSAGVSVQHTNMADVCPVTSHCAEGKALCAHILTCKLKNCTYRGCLTTREVLGHHMRCRDKKCEVCSPVRVLDLKRRYGNERR